VIKSGAFGAYNTSSAFIAAGAEVFAVPPYLQRVRKLAHVSHAGFGVTLGRDDFEATVVKPVLHTARRALVEYLGAGNPRPFEVKEDHCGPVDNSPLRIEESDIKIIKDSYSRIAFAVKTVGIVPGAHSIVWVELEREIRAHFDMFRYGTNISAKAEPGRPFLLQVNLQ
jgi:hypothetical protein